MKILAASALAVGLGLFSMSTVIPIRNGSTLTARAITRTVTNIGDSWAADRPP